MATVIPFPLARRRAFVSRTAWRVANAVPRTGAKLLAHALQQQADTMARRGIAPELIEIEVASLEAAVRAECWRVLHMTGGAA